MNPVEDVKKTVEKATGYARPNRAEAAALLRRRKPRLLHFKSDGMVPNNPTLAVVMYRSALGPSSKFDTAAVFEELFAANGWGDSWRNGIYDFAHYHSKTHEVLGIARGQARVELGGSNGRKLELNAGDIVVMPAGTSHRRLSASADLLVVGAYPAQGSYNECRPSRDDCETTMKHITKVPLPRKDPPYGKDGPLLSAWVEQRAASPGKPARRAL